MRTYSELIGFETFQERFEYLRLKQFVSEETFGGLRNINQAFYSSVEWRKIRSFVISRDLGFDLGILGMEISGVAYVHHMNPITPEILIHKSYLALDPEFLITTSFDTHQAIHFFRGEITHHVERKPGDTKLW